MTRPNRRTGNRSALEWILDQYKEKKPKNATIRARFDSYCFADSKDHVIDLLARVTRVSVKPRRSSLRCVRRRDDRLPLHRQTAQGGEGGARD